MSADTRNVAALIGAGMVAGTHVAACAGAHEKLRLKGILSRSKDRANALAKEASSITRDSVITYDSISDIATDPDINFVIVATPPNVRLDIIAPLAKAGKHILLEKPVARTLEESKAIVQICEDAGVTLGIVFQHRVRAASKKTAEIINEGNLGSLGLVELNIPWWRAQDYYDEPGRGTYHRDGGGVLINQAIHTIDLALSLSGPVKSVFAMSKTSRFHQMESEDFVVAGLEFVNGAAGSMTASTASFPGTPETITLHFDHASLHLEAGQLRVSWRNGMVENFGEESNTGGGADPMAFTHEWHQEILENFSNALNGNSAPIISGKQALAAHELIDATIRSARSGSKQTLTP